MEFKKELLEEEFKKYYSKTGKTATHIFVYSSEQDYIIKRHNEDGKNCYVNDIRYTEMRSRDSDGVFNWEDTKLVSVGNHSDLKRY